MKHPLIKWAIRRPGLIPVFFLSAFFSLNGQLYLPDARSIAIGNILSVTGAESYPFTNPASLGIDPEYSFSIGQSLPFLIKNIGLSSIEGTIPLFPGSLHIALSSFGISGYRNFYHDLSYGLKLSEKLYAGIGFLYTHAAASRELNYLWSLSPKAGILFMPSPLLCFGIVVNSPVHVGNYPDYGPVFPSLASIGCSREFYENCFILAEISCNSAGKLQYKMALDYFPGKWISICTGYHSSPHSISFGTHVNTKNLRIYFAFAWTAVPGITPAILLNYTRPK